VPAYFLIGGASGAAAVVSAVARRFGGDATLVRHARWIAATGTIASSPLLISDLGRPERFLNMLRVFKIQSPMSVGVWTLVAFSNAAVAAAFADLVEQRTGGRVVARVVGNAAETVAAATGLVLSTYTGVLLGATAIPVWSKNATLLPAHFGASALGSAVSILELLGHHDRALNRLGIGAALAESVAAAHIEMSGEPALRELREGQAGTLVRAAGVLSGPVPLLLRLLAGRSAGARRVAALSTIAGSLLTRVAWVEAGRSNARRLTASSIAVGSTLEKHSRSSDSPAGSA
jgi:formate-dependent nitrite reductase membrane component NrfD